METNIRRVFFEPWSLGDVLIAASALREMPESAALACNAKWHPVLKEALPELRDTQLMAVELPYTTRSRNGRFQLSAAASDDVLSIRRTVTEVVSIRTDPRDYLSARRIFPNARIRMSGWIPFVAHYIWLVDLPYSRGLFRVRNRYEAWARMAGVPLDQLRTIYQLRQARAPRNNHIVIHVGAQWRSRQYPYVAELRDLLERQGYTVSVLAGPSDPLPERVPERTVTRAVDGALVDAFRAAERVVTNDSGPMHLAALLGCRTVPVARIANIEEWLPPATRHIASDLMPCGYRPHRLYTSDTLATGWPAPETLVKHLASEW